MKNKNEPYDPNKPFSGTFIGYSLEQYLADSKRRHLLREKRECSSNASSSDQTQLEGNVDDQGKGWQ